MTRSTSKSTGIPIPICTLRCYNFHWPSCCLRPLKLFVVLQKTLLVKYRDPQRKALTPLATQRRQCYRSLSRLPPHDLQRQKSEFQSINLQPAGTAKKVTTYMQTIHCLKTNIPHIDRCPQLHVLLRYVQNLRYFRFIGVLYVLEP
jgi:hypothetical protein